MNGLSGKSLSFIAFAEGISTKNQKQSIKDCLAFLNLLLKISGNMDRQHWMMLSHVWAKRRVVFHKSCFLGCKAQTLMVFNWLSMGCQKTFLLWVIQAVDAFWLAVEWMAGNFSNHIIFKLNCLRGCADTLTLPCSSNNNPNSCISIVGVFQRSNSFVPVIFARNACNSKLLSMKGEKSRIDGAAQARFGDLGETQGSSSTSNHKTQRQLAFQRFNLSSA